MTTSNIAHKNEVHAKYMDTGYFGGFCEPSKNMQSTCCDKSKVHDLRLVLDDWINFTAQTSTNAYMEPSSFTWNAPKKCRG